MEAGDDDFDSTEWAEFDPNDCLLEKSRGPCRAVIDSWFFNVATKSCQPFTWSGCGGNNNRFNEERHCVKHCMMKWSGNDVTAAPSSSSDRHHQRSAKGNDCPPFQGCGLLRCAESLDPVTGCMKCDCGTSPHLHFNEPKESSRLGEQATQVKASSSVITEMKVKTGPVQVLKPENTSSNSNASEPKLPVGSVSGTPSDLGQTDEEEAGKFFSPIG